MSNKFYEVVIWQPSEEQVSQLRFKLKCAQDLFQERKDLIEKVDAAVTEHVREIRLLTAIVKDEREMHEYLERQSKYPDEDFPEDDIDEGDLDGDEYSSEIDSEEEYRQTVGKGRSEFKKIKAVLKKIQKLCHPDVCKFGELHRYSVEANKLAENGDLNGLIMLYSELKEKFDDLIKVGKALTTRYSEYLELKRLLKAVEESIEDQEEDYDYSKLYVTEKDVFLNTTWDLSVEDLVDELREYFKAGLVLNESLTNRINAIEDFIIKESKKPELTGDEMLKAMTAPTPEFKSSDWFNLDD